MVRYLILTEKKYATNSPRKTRVARLHFSVTSRVAYIENSPELERLPSDLSSSRSHMFATSPHAEFIDSSKWAAVQYLASRKFSRELWDPTTAGSNVPWSSIGIMCARLPRNTAGLGRRLWYPCLQCSYSLLIYPLCSWCLESVCQGLHVQLLLEERTELNTIMHAVLCELPRPYVFLDLRLSLPAWNSLSLERFRHMLTRKPISN
jgi:hypothetical protein